MMIVNDPEGAGIEPRSFGKAVSAPNWSATSALHGLYWAEERKVLMKLSGERKPDEQSCLKEQVA